MAKKTEMMDYLKTIDNFISNSQKNNFKYRSMYHFLIENGQFFRDPKEKKFHYKKKECYYNTYKMVSENPELKYVEGFAMSIIPIEHAWAVDPKGYVVDPTWDDGSAYFGVVFPIVYVIRLMFSKGFVGPVIDNWEQKWPLLTGEHNYKNGLVDTGGGHG